MKRTDKYKQRSDYRQQIRDAANFVEVAKIDFERYKHYDYDLEAAIIGICYMESDGMARVRRFLAPQMFYHAFHQEVWEAMCEMFDAALPIDLLTVRNYMANHKGQVVEMMEESNLNWSADLVKLSMYVTGSTHLEYWAILIREQYIARELLKVTTGGLGEGLAREELTRIQSKIDDLMQFRVVKDDWLHISDVFIKLWQHMVDVQGKDIVGLPFGFTHLDQVTSGMSPGLYYLGARPSVGKTAFAIKLILNQAADDQPVGIISLETPGVKLGARMLSMLSSVDFWRIWRNKMSEELSQRVFTYTGMGAQLPIYISDQPAVTLSDIRAKAMKLVRMGAKAIYLDYIQLVTPDEGAGTREQEVAKMSRGLKLISMVLNIPIIALAQLSRESERRTDKTPRLIDLRESGSIEQDADGVMFLHRPEMVNELTDENGDSTKGKAQLIIAKWRDGETFTHPMRFIGDRMEFVEDEVAIAEKQGWNAQKSESLPNRTPSVNPDQYHSPNRDEGADTLPF